MSPNGLDRSNTINHGSPSAAIVGSLLFLLLISAAPGTTDQGSSAPPAVSPKQDTAVATVGSARIASAELERELAASRAATPGQKQAVLEKLVRFELLHAAALAAGYESRPQIAESFRRLVAGAFVQEQLEPKLAGLQVTDEEIKKYFDGHLADFTIPQAVRAAVIQIKVSPKASGEKRAELRARAEAARAEALALPAATASFGSVAVTYSEDQATRYRGGDTGWLRVGQRDPRWDKEVVDAIFALQKPGEVGPVVAAASGFHVVRLMEIRASVPRALDDVRDQISQLILTAKKMQAERDFYAALAAKIPVSIDEQALAAVPLPESHDTPSRTPPTLPEP